MILKGYSIEMHNYFSYSCGNQNLRKKKKAILQNAHAALFLTLKFTLPNSKNYKKSTTKVS